MIKKVKAAGLAVVMSIMMVTASGCSDAEENTAVRAPLAEDKNYNGLLEEAENTEGKVDYTTDGAIVTDGSAADMVKLDDYRTTLESDNGVIKVEVDAPINIPECDNYPLVTVSRKPLDNDFLKAAKTLLIGDAELYDGVRVMDPEYERIMKDGTEIESIDGVDLSGQVYFENISKYPIETGLYNITGKASEYSDMPEYDDYYMQLMPDGDMFYGVTDGSDGSFASISVVNSERYGSSFRYFKNKDYFVPNGLVLPGINVYTWDKELGKEYFYDESLNPTPYIGMPTYEEPEYDDEGNVIQWVGSNEPDPDCTGFKITESVKETNNISREEALKQADEMLAALGYRDQYAVVQAVDSYLIGEGSIVKNKAADGKYSLDVIEGRVWDIVYERAINGNIVENYGEKYSETYNRSGSEKHVWSCEYIEVFVNDNGVVGVCIGDPLTAEEIVADNIGLKDIEEIKKIYEDSQLETLNESPYFDSILSEEAGPLQYSIKINDISLKYTKVTEPDDFEKGLMVPVWDFSGVCYDESGNETGTGSFLQINAIDGTIYNAEVGY